MFDQIRVDGGKEFYLMLGVQEIFQNLRSNQTIVPYRQTQSRQVITFCSFFHNKRMGEDIKKRRIHFLFYKNHENLLQPHFLIFAEIRASNIVLTLFLILCKCSVLIFLLFLFLAYLLKCF